MTFHAKCTVAAEVDLIHGIASGKVSAHRNLTLDECRAIVGDKPVVSPFYRYSPEAMTDALFAIAGGRVTKVGL